MLKRLVTDVGISCFILLMIWSAYFVTAQNILGQSEDWMHLCGQVAMLEESLDKLKLRKWLVEHKDLPETTKATLVVGYDEQIALFEKKIRTCGTIK